MGNRGHFIDRLLGLEPCACALADAGRAATFESAGIQPRCRSFHSTLPTCLREASSLPTRAVGMDSGCFLVSWGEVALSRP